jgi:hypothetical protein
MNCAMVWAPVRVDRGAGRASVRVRPAKASDRGRSRSCLDIPIGSEPCASPIVVMGRVMPGLRPENTRLTASNVA